MFHVGQKVVCIDNKDDDGAISKILTVGAVYTIAKLLRGQFLTADFQLYRGLGVQLFEVKLPGEYFRSTRFRPLTERKTDISVFTEMLDKDKVPA